MNSTESSDARISANVELNEKEIAAGATELRSTPLYMSLPHGRAGCNARCVFCNPEFREAQHGAALDFNKYLSILKSYVASTSFVRIIDWGEPFLVRNLRTIVASLHESMSPRTRIGITTNGLLIDQELISMLTRVRYMSVTVSLNASNARLHQELMHTTGFHRILRNIEYLKGLKVSKFGNPQVCLSFVATLMNVCDLPSFIELASRLQVDYVVLQDAIVFSPSFEPLSLRRDPQLARDCFQKAVAKARLLGVRVSVAPPIPGYFLEDQNREDFFCLAPWTIFSVASNGDVYPCCYCAQPLGNIHQASPEEIWNGKSYKLMRDGIVQKTYVSDCISCERMHRGDY